MRASGALTIPFPELAAIQGGEPMKQLEAGLAAASLLLAWLFASVLDRKVELVTLVTLAASLWLGHHELKRR
jgi:hypothetical protein